jgi:arabinan endo-1,5-alpha-L-arabinosidase
VAPGHNSIAQDRRGEHWILYHAVDARRPRAKPDAEINTRRVLLLDRLSWKDGWPVLATAGPSTGPQARPPARSGR